MPRSFTKLYIHAIWAVKNRESLLLKPIQKQLFSHIFCRFKKKSICIIRVNGTEDHVYCLFRIPATITIAEAVKAIKGESSRWINQTCFNEGEFSWQEGYAAFSVDASSIDRIIRYIDNQELHHRKFSFTDELNLLLPKK